MATEPEDFTSDSIRRKALSAAIDDLQRTYDGLCERPSVVISLGAFGRLDRMREVLKSWPNPDNAAPDQRNPWDFWTPESARARVGGTMGT